MDITDEQKTKMMESMIGPLGDNAKILGPVFMNVIESMSKKEFNILMNAAEDIMKAQVKLVNTEKEKKNENPWFK